MTIGITDGASRRPEPGILKAEGLANASCEKVYTGTPLALIEEVAQRSLCEVTQCGVIWRSC